MMIPSHLFGLDYDDSSHPPGWLLRIRLQPDRLPPSVQLTATANRLLLRGTVRLAGVLRYSDVESLIKLANTEAFATNQKRSTGSVSNSGCKSPRPEGTSVLGHSADYTMDIQLTAVPGILTFLSGSGTRKILNRQSFIEMCEAASGVYSPSPLEDLSALPNPNQETVIDLALEVASCDHRESSSPHLVASCNDVRDASHFVDNTVGPAEAFAVPKVPYSDSRTFQIRPGSDLVASSAGNISEAARPTDSRMQIHPESASMVESPSHLVVPRNGRPNSFSGGMNAGRYGTFDLNKAELSKASVVAEIGVSGLGVTPVGTLQQLQQLGPVNNSLRSAQDDSNWHPLDDMLGSLGTYAGRVQLNSVSRQLFHESRGRHRSASSRTNRTSSDISNGSIENIRVGRLDEEAPKVMFRSTLGAFEADKDMAKLNSVEIPDISCSTPLAVPRTSGDDFRQRLEASLTTAAFSGSSGRTFDFSPDSVSVGIGGTFQSQASNECFPRHASAQGLGLWLNAEADFKVTPYCSVIEESQRNAAASAVGGRRAFSNSRPNFGVHARHLSRFQGGMANSANLNPSCIAGGSIRTCNSKHLMEVVPCGHCICKQCLERSIVSASSHRGCPACGLVVQDLKPWHVFGKPPLPPRAAKQFSGSFEGYDQPRRTSMSTDTGFFRNRNSQPPAINGAVMLSQPAGLVAPLSPVVATASRGGSDQLTQTQLVDCLASLLHHYNHQEQPDGFRTSGNGPQTSQPPCYIQLGNTPPEQDYRCFEARGPRPLLQVLLVLESAGVLTPPMLAAVLLQFLPTIFQRVQKKAGRVNKGPSVAVAAKLNAEHPGLYLALIKALSVLDEIPDLAKYSMQFRASLSGKSGTPRLGTLLLSTLQAFSSSPFVVQSKLMEAVVPDLLPHWKVLLRWCSSKGADAEDTGVTLRDMTHWGTTCAGCGLKNIYGPRFHCDTCAVHGHPTIDFCGPCYIKRLSLHDASHSFRCLFRDVRHKIEGTPAPNMLPNMIFAQKIPNALPTGGATSIGNHDDTKVGADSLLASEIIAKLQEAHRVVSELNAAQLPGVMEDRFYEQFQYLKLPPQVDPVGAHDETATARDVRNVPMNRVSTGIPYNRARHPSLEEIHRHAHGDQPPLLHRQQQPQMKSLPPFGHYIHNNSSCVHSTSGEGFLDTAPNPTYCFPPSGTASSVLTGSFESIDQISSQTMYQLLQSNSMVLESKAIASRGDTIETTYNIGSYPADSSSDMTSFDIGTTWLTDMRPPPPPYGPPRGSATKTGSVLPYPAPGRENVGCTNNAMVEAGLELLR